MKITQNIGESFIMNINKLIKANKISEEIFIFDSYICNMSIINLDHNEIDTTFSYYTKYPATGLMYLVSVDYIPNFKNKFSFFQSYGSVANDYAICYNNVYAHNLCFIENENNSTINIFYDISTKCDMLRHIKILNNFQKIYSYSISIGNNNDNYIKLGTFNTITSNNIIFEKYINMLSDTYFLYPIPSYIKITVNESNKSDWDKLNYSLGEIFLDINLRDKVKKLNKFFIQKI